MHNQEWHDRRRKTLGASEVASVVGLSKWADAFSVWESKVLGKVSGGSMATELGHLLQPTVAELARRELGGTIISEELYKVHPVETWASATLDYVMTTPTEGEVIVECKATRDQYWSEIPSYYQTQLAWQCWVHGIDTAYIAVLHASTKFEMYKFTLKYAMDEWLPETIEQCREFWNDYVLTGFPPSSWTYSDDLLDQIQAEPGKKVELPQNAAITLSELHSVRAQIKELETKETFLQDVIKGFMSDAEIANIDGKPVATWKETRSSRLDTKALKADQPELYSKYTAESVSRRFVLKPLKDI